MSTPIVFTCPARDEDASIDWQVYCSGCVSLLCDVVPTSSLVDLREVRHACTRLRRAHHLSGPSKMNMFRWSRVDELAVVAFASDGRLWRYQQVQGTFKATPFAVGVLREGLPVQASSQPLIVSCSVLDGGDVVFSTSNSCGLCCVPLRESGQRRGDAEAYPLLSFAKLPGAM
jgi:hypothetical protein